MNVLITGCNSFLAHHLIKEIKSKKPNWSLSGIDIKNTENQLTSFTLNNLNDKEKWNIYLKDKYPDIIFHLIGIYGIKDREILLESNFNNLCIYSKVSLI